MAKSNIRKYTKKDTSTARQFAHSIIVTLNKEIKKIDKKVVYSPRRVGSAATNTIVCNTDGTFDLDYQFVLSKNVDTSNPTYLRTTVFSEGIKRVLKDDKTTIVQDSKSVITVLKFLDDDKVKMLYSVDFAIVGYDVFTKSGKEVDGESSIIRRNPQGQNQQIFTWNILGTRHAGAYETYNSQEDSRRAKVCDMVVERKIDNKIKCIDKPGFAVFVEVINEVIIDV